MRGYLVMILFNFVLPLSIVNSLCCSSHLSEMKSNGSCEPIAYVSVATARSEHEKEIHKQETRKNATKLVNGTIVK